jgi:hypothetical protein
MPDIFAGITILAIANLLAAGKCISSLKMTSWIVLLSAGLRFHNSHVLLTVAMLFTGVGLALLVRVHFSWRAVGGVLAALLTVIAGEMIFSLITAKLVGAPPLRPPFLMARMIVDGPGYRYLALSRLPVWPFANSFRGCRV